MMLEERQVAFRGFGSGLGGLSMLPKSVGQSLRTKSTCFRSCVSSTKAERSSEKWMTTATGSLAGPN